MEISFDPTIIAVILGLVEFAKRLGASGNVSLAISVIIGAALGVGHTVSVQGAPVDFAGWFQVSVVGGLAYGLTASGLYDVGKRFTAK